MTGAALVVIFASALVTINTAAILKCSDYKGALFHNAEEYIPHKEEPCKACKCEKGFPSMCRQLPCSPPPKNCKHVAQVEGCCKYLCLDKFRRTPGTTVENDNCTDIAIIGAGVAGAYTAWLLRSRNLTVDVYEFSDRIGGRLHTAKLPHIPDVNIELGGMRFVPDWHPRLYKVIKALGLDMVDFQPKNASKETLYYVRGRQLREADFTTGKLPYNLKGEEKGKSPDALRWKVFSENTNYTDRGPREFRIGKDLLQISTRDGLLLHDQSYEGMFRSVASEEAYSYIRDTEGFQSFFGSTSAAVHIPLSGPKGWSNNSPYKTLKNGMDHLPKSLLKAALEGQSNRLHLNRRLTKIQTLPSRKYQLTFKETVTKKDGYTRDKFGRKSFVKTCAKKVILALPRMALAGINWHGFKKHRLFKRYISSVTDTPIAKIYLGFRSPWWDELNVTFSKVTTDLPLSFVLKGGVSPDTGRAVLLVAYKDNDISYWKQLSKLGKPIRGTIKTPYAVTTKMVAHIKRHLAEIFGLETRQIPDPISGALSVWDDYPFGGGYNMWLPGYDWDDVRKTMTRPSSKDHVYTVGSVFAFHDSQAWIEGALARSDELVDEYF
ncbi:L-amino-acid oxidase-like [Haliotis rufescens]|uniref:L-amino-acid oxidase-like n=1 Tax=Haliotis rufescens TaxID=6454 RepID=UPI001EB044E5|nr:L-amino-acid oxidase-like [Haliotis rufescens]XP_046352988.1 L-amino-acid oxidase-like [Haliotis rufescens]XP_046352996.1 L-amino-acid oxidase-like [Haliotis rufescens]